MDDVAVRVTAMKKQGPELLKRGLSVLHESLADYMLVNPGATLRQMGDYFGYSVPWLSLVTTSDLFRAYMAERRSEICSNIAQGLPQKLEQAAHLATERIMEVIEKAEDADVIIDAFDKVLHRCGYAPNSKVAPVTINNQQNNVFYLDKKELAAEREKLLGAHANQAALPAPAAEKEVSGVTVST